MIITCPHCQTKYQVTYEVIGSVRRKVQCAHCHKDWDQEPTPPAPKADPKAPDAGDTGRADQLFDAMAEDALDEAMAAEASAVAASQARPLPHMDAAEMQKRQMAFKRRQNAMSSSLPLARLRRAARIAGVVILIGLVGGAYFGRVPIVERYPDMAGLYEAIGLGVNVVGLDFTNLETLKSLSGGNDVLTVSAQIVGKSARPVRVPPVVISLLDASGHAVYEWSVTPRVRDLMAGERATFDTRLSLPPSEAVHVRLSFAGQGFNSGERGAGAAETAETPQPSMADALAVPDETLHTAPAADQHDQAAEPDHAPAPAASEHH